MWNRMDRQELERLKLALAKATPGTPQYKELLEQRLKFDQTVTREIGNGQLLPGVKNETLAVGLIGAVQMLGLAKLQDTSFLPKNLISLLPLVKVKL